MKLIFFDVTGVQFYNCHNINLYFTLKIKVYFHRAIFGVRN